jgi:pyruvate/2-oxoglutarate dehydrogenase complex dihydrolipoamide dehydrogenase (E3) component
VGLSDAHAQRQGVDVRVAKLPISAVLRAHTTGDKHGFMKALVGARHDCILGFTMLGLEAGEVVATVHAVMLAGLPYSTLRDAVLAHPAIAEGLRGWVTSLNLYETDRVLASRAVLTGESTQ